VPEPQVAPQLAPRPGTFEFEHSEVGVPATMVRPVNGPGRQVETPGASGLTTGDGRA